MLELGMDEGGGMGGVFCMRLLLEWRVLGPA